MNCFRNGWYRNWEKNGWKTSQKKPVENQELWKELLALVRQHQVQFFRVKGHVNIDSPAINKDKLYQKFISWNGSRFTMEDFEYVTRMNNRADELANMGTDEAKLRG